MCCAPVIRLALTLHGSHLWKILKFCLRLYFKILCSSWTAKNTSAYLLILWQELFIFGMEGGGGVLLAHRIMQEFCLYVLCGLCWMRKGADKHINTLRMGDADLRFYITTVQDGWRKSVFLTCTCFPCTIHLIMQYIEPVSEWSCWRMFIETWPHSELTFRHRTSSI